MSDDLPPGWSNLRLGEAQIEHFAGAWGSAPEVPGKLLRVIRNGDIGPTGEISHDLPTRSFSEREAAKAQLRQGDILVTTSGDVGKAALWRSASNDAAASNFVRVLRSSDAVIPEWLFHFLKSHEVRRKFEKHSRGSTIMNLSSALWAELQVPTPPRNEQLRIVEKLERLLDKVNVSGKRLARTSLLLKRFRQSTLYAGLTGSLTQDLNNGDGLEFQERVVAEVCSFSQGVQVDLKNQFQNRQDGTVRFLRIIDFTQGTEAPRFIVDPGPRYHVLGKDLSMVRYGASTGFICRGLEGVIANNLFRIFPSGELESSYLYYFFKSDFFRRPLANSLQGVAMPAINFKFFKDVSIRFPSLSVQQEIVRRMEGLFALADQLEMRLVKARGQVDQLVPSLLARAFAGKLVPQDPKDEPASMLLERIRKTANNGEPKRKSKRAALPAIKKALL
jgi:type I restriction enzyme S subunit